MTRKKKGILLNIKFHRDANWVGDGKRQRENISDLLLPLNVAADPQGVL